MNIFVLAGGFIGLVVFLILKPRIKVLIAFFVMSQCFDLAPQLLFGKLVWDFGAVLLLISAAQLIFLNKRNSDIDSTTIKVLGVFFGWLVICLMYSIFVYGYPIMETLKTSRHMIVGYLSIFIFLRLFSVDKNAFEFFARSLYIITFVLLLIIMIQFLTKTPLLFGLATEYAGVNRYIPIFLSISLVYMWFILSKILTAYHVKKHELVYVALTVFTTALTFTRGIYIAVVFVFLLMLFVLFRERKLEIKSAIVPVFLLIIFVPVLVYTGSLDRVIGRAASGLEILLTDKTKRNKTNSDTFSGRINLFQERVSLVVDHNPIVGYGFIHEDNVPRKLRNSLKSGSVIYTPEMVKKYQNGHFYVLALYSVDIGWANLVIITGLTGFTIFLIFIVSFILSYRKTRVDDLRVYHFRLAFYLQTVVLLLLMFNGSTFTNHVQISGMIIAGYIFCSRKSRNATLDNTFSEKTAGNNHVIKNINYNSII